jgi:hypothetical protein
MTLGRWIVIAVGLIVLAVSLNAAVKPYREIREFRDVVACDRVVGNCFTNESGSITGRRTYTETTTHTDANGGTSTTTTTHYEVTWQRADGSVQAREVSTSFYGLAREGQPANLRIYDGHVVGIQVMGGAEWFLPKSGRALGWWLLLAFFGLGVTLWGLLFGWWDGFFMLAWRTFVWMFMAFTPVNLLTTSLAYGFNGARLVGGLLFSVFAIGVAGWMLSTSLERRWRF